MNSGSIRFLMMSPRETTPISFSSLQNGIRMIWKSYIILIILVARVFGFTVATSGVMLSPAVTRVSSGLWLKARRISSSVMMPMTVPSSSVSGISLYCSDINWNAISLSEAFSWLRLPGVSLFQQRFCLPWLITSFLIQQATECAGHLKIIYLLINNRYIKKVINTRKPAQRKRDECRKINKNRILYLKSILREGCRVKGFLWW